MSSILLEHRGAKIVYTLSMAKRDPKPRRTHSRKTKKRLEAKRAMLAAKKPAKRRAK